MPLLRRRMMMKQTGGEDMEREWRLLKTITLDDLPDAQNETIVSADDDGYPFEVDEFYIRITSGKRYGNSAYNEVKINGMSIGEIRGSFPCEVFVKNIGGIWRAFYIAYSGNYSNGTLASFGTFQYQLRTLDEIPKISQISLNLVDTLEMKVYAR